MKTAALALGVILLAIGIAGFVPALHMDGLLFGVMPMSTVMSVLFVITGLAGIAIGMSYRRRVPPMGGGGDGSDMRSWM